MKPALRVIYCLIAMLTATPVFADSAGLFQQHNAFSPKRLPGVSGHWFVGVGAGFDFSTLGDKTNTLLNNTGGNPPDTFSLSQPTTSRAAQEILAGYRFTLGGSRYLSLQLNYLHMNAMRVSEVRVPLASPASSSVDTYTVQRQALLLLGQFDFFRWHRLLPFVQAGVGIAKNTFENFNDMNVFTMPAFPNATYDQLAGLIGVGIDFEATHHVLLGMLYRFNDWGRLKSGTVHTVTGGAALPAPIQLTHTLTSMQLLGTVNYIF